MNDARLSARLASLGQALSIDPGQSFPAALDEAGLEGAYRFLGNSKVEPSRILQPHVRETLLRAQAEDTVLAIHDTTSFDYGSGGKRTGLGRKRSAGQCFFAHTTLAVSGDGSRRPLGAIGLHTYVRDQQASAGREAGRWLQQMHAVADAGFRREKVIHVADRESDSYATLTALSAGEHRFVLRMSKDRRLLQKTPIGARKVAEAMRSVETKVERDVPLCRRISEGRNPLACKLHPSRDSRIASLSIGAQRVTFDRPKHLKTVGLPDSYSVNIVRVWEPDPPAGDAPIEWLLLTSEPIDTVAQLEKVVDHYRARWVIEEFFKALKSECKLEERQLESYHSLRNALAVFMPIAWTLLRLRSTARQSPDAPATAALDADEVHVLRAIARTPLPENPSCREVMLAIAALGGHLKRNGEPGWKTLTLGYRKLSAQVAGFRIAPKSRKRSDQS